ncbi:hypothetical protein BDY19DRAFT_909932 [Irpex rosettiformis]|uniref:Uncharacterized protein n=1 Tax=Irpex rosettiformis TaxID=378272 RepID=A0ACB8TR81_9APHY|nr:hypothetical protein BDY19DRAFT_909932 [Irpex rosettiformis]
MSVMVEDFPRSWSPARMSFDPHSWLYILNFIPKFTDIGTTLYDTTDGYAVRTITSFLWDQGDGSYTVIWVVRENIILPQICIGVSLTHDEHHWLAYVPTPQGRRQCSIWQRAQIATVLTYRDIPRVEQALLLTLDSLFVLIPQCFPYYSVVKRRGGLTYFRLIDNIIPAIKLTLSRAINTTMARGSRRFLLPHSTYRTPDLTIYTSSEPDAFWTRIRLSLDIITIKIFLPMRFDSECFEPSRFPFLAVSHEELSVVQASTGSYVGGRDDWMQYYVKKERKKERKKIFVINDMA